jgi:hypothetical protein
VLVAETVAPKLVIVAEQVVLQLPIVALPPPSAAFEAPVSVTESVSPVHAVGRPPTFTCVTFPELSTLRVAVTEERPQEETVWLPADNFAELMARVAAAAHVANVAATVSPNAIVLVKRFISVLLSLCLGFCKTKAPPQGRPGLTAVRRTDPAFPSR